MAQAFDIPDDRDLHIEALQARKIAEEFEVLGSVSEEPQFDVAPAVPEAAYLLHLQIALGPQKVKPVASLVQRTPRVQSKRRLCINVADTFLMGDGLAAQARAGAVRHDRGSQGFEPNIPQNPNVSLKD
jgi:hypothetical protein